LGGNRGEARAAGRQGSVGRNSGPTLWLTTRCTPPYLGQVGISDLLLGAHSPSLEWCILLFYSSLSA
jgi:hypothetical protein